ncbi:hypothetical protein BD414DRAFT_487010 [Trametes punicea]|nr:hypothetical protein BD414DRAFT_487010 [Trametes punicea]
MRHCDEAHLKLRYGCPGECTAANGDRRTWVRPDELTRHENMDPCDYLREHPLPRSGPRARSRDADKEN